MLSRLDILEHDGADLKTDVRDLRREMNERFDPMSERMLVQTPHRPYTIRPADPADLDRLGEMLLALQDHLEASNPGLWRLTDQARADLKGRAAARLDDPHGCVLVAEHERDGIVGMIFGQIAANDRYAPARAGLIDRAFVEADHRRRGVGARLVAELCRFFAAQGVDDVSLRYVVGNEEAAAFWAGLGFVPLIITAGVDRRTVEEAAGLDRQDAVHKAR